MGRPGEGKTGLPCPPEPEPLLGLLCVVMIDLGDVMVLRRECRRGDDCKE